MSHIIKEKCNRLKWPSKQFNIYKGSNSLGQRMVLFDWMSYIDEMEHYCNISISIAKVIGYKDKYKIRTDAIHKNKKFDIKGSSYSGEASVKNIIGNWWSHKILQAESQISPISGSIKEQMVTFIGKENISINGKQYETDHFKLTSKDTSLPEDKKLNFDIWLDKKTSVIVKVTYERMGNWEYRLKNLD